MNIENFQFSDGITMSIFAMLVVFLILVLLQIIIYSFKFLPQDLGQKKSAAPSAAPAAVEVATIVVAPQSVTLTTELPGRTAAFRVAEIRPQVNGLIQKRLFTEGTDVKAGDVLYQIDPAPYQAAYNHALANLEAARKMLERTRAAQAASLRALAWGRE